MLFYFSSLSFYATFCLPFKPIFQKPIWVRNALPFSSIPCSRSSFPSSMISNLWRCLETSFGIEIKQKRFYTLRSSTALPWMISSTPKSVDRSSAARRFLTMPRRRFKVVIPGAQNIVSVGLLKRIKGRWGCLFLDYRFYLPKKTIQAQKETATIRGKVLPFQTKLEQAGQILIGIVTLLLMTRLSC